MRNYLGVLSAPRVPALLVSAILARLPLSINSLATVLYLQAQTGSFAIAGAAAGGGGLGIGLGGIFQSRLVDRLGRRLVLPAAGLHAALLAVLILGGAERWPGALLVLAATAAGLAVPPTSSLLRAVYPTLFAGDPERLSSAFAIDAATVDFAWVVGPLLVAALASLASPAFALGVSAAAGLTGTALFLAAAAAVLPVAVGSPPRAGGGALRSPGVLTLALSTLPLGFAFGALEVAIPAFAKAVGRIHSAGVLLALFAVSSIAGTLAFGVLRGRVALLSAHLWLGIALPPAIALLLAGTSAPTMAALVLVPGLLIGPLVTSRNELTSLVARPGTETEAYMWPISAIFAGTAGGAAAAGVIVEASGWHVAVAVAAAVALSGTVVAGLRRATLAAR